MTKFSTTTFAAALLAATMISSAAVAGDATRGPYISGQLGYNKTVGDSGTLDNAASFAAAAGYRFNPNVRVEGEVSYRNNDYADTITGASASGDIKGTTLMANAWYDFANASALTPYVGGGLGIMRANADVKFPGFITTIDDSDVAFAWQLGGGLAYDVTSSVALTADYRYMDTGNFNFKVSNGGVANIDAGDYSAHEVRVGARYSF